MKLMRFRILSGWRVIWNTFFDIDTIDQNAPGDTEIAFTRHRQEPRGIALGPRVLGDQLLRKLVKKLACVHKASGSRSRLESDASDDVELQVWIKLMEIVRIGSDDGCSLTACDEHHRCIDDIGGSRTTAEHT